MMISRFFYFQIFLTAASFAVTLEAFYNAQSEATTPMTHLYRHAQSDAYNRGIDFEINAEMIDTPKEIVQKHLNDAHLAQAAYNDLGSDTFKIDSAGQRHHFHTEYEDQSGFIQENKDGTLALVIKGSDNRANWKTNFWANWAWDRNYNLRVHNGFLEHWRAMREAVVVALEGIAQKRNQKVSDLTLDVLGHSLGGGTAHVAAFDLNNLLNIKRVKTFGAPMAFDVTSAELYNEQLGNKTENLAQLNDPVPWASGVSPLTFVPRAMTGFVTNEGKHVGYNVILPADEKIHVLEGYKSSLENALTSGYSLADEGKHWFRRGIDAVRALPARGQNYLHKYFKKVKNTLFPKKSTKKADIAQMIAIDELPDSEIDTAVQKTQPTPVRAASEPIAKKSKGGFFQTIGKVLRGWGRTLSSV